MAISKLHIICGNCGASDDFTFVVEPKGHDVTDDKVAYEQAVFISCGNCSTLHDLSDFMEDTTWPTMPVDLIEKAIVSHQRIGAAMSPQEKRNEYADDIKKLKEWIE